VPRFVFTGRTKEGKPHNGTIEAPNEEEAVALLQGREIIVVSLEEGIAKPASVGRHTGTHRSVNSSDLVIFARSLSAMLDAGLPLLRSMEVVGDQARSQHLQKTIAEMTRDIRGGSTFRDAIAKHPTIFTAFWINLVETGEASGQLTKSLEQISVHMEKSGAVQRKVVSAMIYPLILLVGAIIAVLVFTLKIIPTFAEMYSSMGSDLPLLTQMVMSFSKLLSKYFLLCAAGVAGLWFALRVYVKTPPGQWQFDMLKLRMPLIGPLLQLVAAQTFAANLGTLLKAGVPILHALEISISTCNNKVVASVLEHMKEGVREGRPLADPLGQTDIFPSMVAQMIAVGEQTGRLPNMLEEIAHYYDEQVTTAVDRLTTLVEPIMLIGIAVVIGTLVLAMYLPIFQMSSAMKS